MYSRRHRFNYPNIYYYKSILLNKCNNVLANWLRLLPNCYHINVILFVFIRISMVGNLIIIVVSNISYVQLDILLRIIILLIFILCHNLDITKLDISLPHYSLNVWILYSCYDTCAPWRLCYNRRIIVSLGRSLNLSLILCLWCK